VQASSQHISMDLAAFCYCSYVDRAAVPNQHFTPRFVEKIEPVSTRKTGRFTCKFKEVATVLVASCNGLKHGQKVCRDNRCGTIPNKHSMVWEEDIHPRSPFPFPKRLAINHSVKKSAPERGQSKPTWRLKSFNQTRAMNRADAFSKMRIKRALGCPIYCTFLASFHTPTSSGGP
jgi:hypothetical protein